MKLNYVTFGVASVAASSIIAGSALGIANADAPSSSTTNTNVGTSGISRTVFRQDRLAAEAQVLNTTTAQVQAAQNDKTLTRLIADAGLTKQTFRQNVETQLTTELEDQGYTQSQVTLVLQHRMHHGLHHHKKS